MIRWWLALAVLLALECGASFLPLGHAGGALLLVPGLAMAVIVAFAFMRLGRASGVAQAFALFGVFWVLVLLGLGSMDAMTRHDIPVRITTYP